MALSLAVLLAAPRGNRWGLREAQPVDVIDHPALWSPDFPLLAIEIHGELRKLAAIARPSCRKILGGLAVAGKQAIDLKARREVLGQKAVTGVRFTLRNRRQKHIWLQIKSPQYRMYFRSCFLESFG